MTCSNCGGFFCWSCLAIIKGYDHFENNPTCWGILEAEIMDNIDETDNFEHCLKNYINEKVDNYCVCPQCQFFNLRGEDKVNDILCQKCKRNFCYNCNELLPEAEDYLRHFDISDCYLKELS